MTKLRGGHTHHRVLRKVVGVGLKSGAFRSFFLKISVAISFLMLRNLSEN